MSVEGFILLEIVKFHSIVDEVLCSYMVFIRWKTINYDYLCQIRGSCILSVLDPYYL